MEKRVDVLSFLPNENLVFESSNLEEFFETVKTKGEKIEFVGGEDGTVCFTGNRPASLPWKYNESCDLCVDFKKRLKELIFSLYKHGFKNFVSGMALGFDTLAAEAVLALRKEGCDITLTCAVPFKNQSAKWASSQKERYLNIINQSDSIVYVSENYDPGAYQRRNEYMVNISDALVAFSSKEDGGTVATVEYAKKSKKPIIFVK